MLGIEVQSFTSSLALGLLLSRKTELRPLRVYGEQAEATEFPLPGVSSRSILTKTSQEGRPNQNLRYNTSVCAGVEARGPPLDRVSPILPPRSITLHHRIRQAPNPYAAEIRKFDAQLREGKILTKEDLVV